MKRLAQAREPPIVVPVIVVAVDIHIPLVVPPVEDRVAHRMKYLLYHRLSIPLKTVLYAVSQIP